MNWSKLIYRAIIINSVFWITWKVYGLPDPGWVIPVIAGVFFGFIIDYDEQ